MTHVNNVKTKNSNNNNNNNNMSSFETLFIAFTHQVT